MAKKRKNSDTLRNSSKKSNATPQGQSASDAKSSFSASGSRAKNSKSLAKPEGGTAHATASAGGTRNPLRRLAAKVTGLFQRAAAAPARTEEKVEKATRVETAPANADAAKQARIPKRTTDVAMETLAETYTPSYTASKAGFRSDGSDHQQDQEMSIGVTDERWNDEDRLTNKSGDPRIGTRGRSYEPGETLRASASNRNEEDRQSEA